MRRQPAARTSGQSLIPALIAAAVLIVSAIVATTLRTDKTKPSPSAANDISYVWQLTAQLAEQEQETNATRWLIRYDVDGMTSSDVLRTASRFGLRFSEERNSNEDDKELSSQSMRTITYEGELLVGREASQDGSTAVPVAFYLNNESAEGAIVIVQPPAGLTAKQLQEAAEQVEAVLQQAGGQYEYSFRVSGSAALAGTINLAAMHQLADDVAEQAEARLVERYEDAAGAAINETRMSPHIDASIDTNGRKANIQISIHRDSETGAANWVVGVPVITGDYTAVS
ncbi:YwmB family TATA-box binding protein [Paenibacillus xylaniclasticus]|uniref:YwmB family TATA-box binding protein n=1 Tax=Paenibacillus xylaniclasticus TaxID=588083 RepID=UPI000FD983BB|nr:MULTISPECIES: YwmB family TATA-box binding protein [Paenibacillus]GFN33354.1 hypothetical protein PCURB6_36140 [Paenibacillus curdlanolyticus]